ncbi:Bug family tripartite tricarboxylate transporter substrate binding protein [Neoroseomonas soli]|uniref:Tripartite tricarboxylate transporter substrate binding protein n=1 Tax=Neoroseomonas soli TaxID=1081025 RepID=A0A9X9X3E3_9PROT|nr:tripartite tricarboxylate transporter substrate binding protein [Neoroseomonas soli]MBR0673922.1 tripartite tricarboxylate transporter substrate binding protein [Neoroseomonas soli]
MTHRRSLLAAALAGLAPLPLRAQGAWPDRPVRLVVPTLGGAGTADTVARILAQELDKRMPQRVVVENRAGANGNVGAAYAARSPADGYTFLWGWAGTLATNPALYRELPFDPLRDFDPVVLVGNVPNILVVNRALGPRTLAEFTAYARANPGKINFGSTGNGSSMHLAGELYRQMTRTEMQHVPYSGPAPAVTDLLSNRIQAMFNLVTGALPQVRAGEVIPLALLDDARAPQLPEVPTTAELGMTGLTFGTWFMVMAPKGTPEPILARMNTLVNEVVADPEGKQRLQGAGLALWGGTRQRAAEFLATEIRRHAEIVRASGARVD